METIIDATFAPQNQTLTPASEINFSALSTTQHLLTDLMYHTANWAIEELYNCTTLTEDCELECTHVKFKPQTDKVQMNFKWIADSTLSDPDTNAWQSIYEEDCEVFTYTVPDFEEQLYQYLEETITTNL